MDIICICMLYDRIHQGYVSDVVMYVLKHYTDLFIMHMIYIYICTRFLLFSLGICQLYEQAIKENDPSVQRITYSMNDLFVYIDNVQKMTILL